VNTHILILIALTLVALAVLALHLYVSYKVWRRFPLAKALLSQLGLSLAAYIVYGVALSPILLFVGFDAPNALYIGSLRRDDLDYIVGLHFTNLYNYLPVKDNGFLFVVLWFAGRFGLFFVLGLLMAPLARSKTDRLANNVQQ
jgi:hypothetical protein